MSKIRENVRESGVECLTAVPLVNRMLHPNTFNDDKLGLKPFCEKLEKFLLIEHDFVEGGLVVSLDAPFGSGKSTFLRMWKHELDLRQIADQSLPQAFVLNAWELDYCNDPLFAILARLVPAITANDKGKLTELREAATDFGWYMTALANDVASKIVGVDAIKAGEFAGKKKEARSKKPDFLKIYEDRAKAFDRLKESLEAIFGGSNPKAFVLVDELDRCRPDYAVTYLETIKHMFDIHGLVFVLAIDSKHLESSARSLFGDGLQFNEYFRKFVQRTFTLPSIKEDGYEKLSDFYVEHFIETIGKRVSLMKVEDVSPRVKELASGLKLNPRQIQEAFRIIGHVASGNDERRGRLYWCIGAGIILMSILKVGRSELFHAIGHETQDNLKIGQILKSIMPESDAVWWFKLYLTGLQKHDTTIDFESLLKELKFIPQDYNLDGRNEFGSFYHGWGSGGGNKSRIVSIYQNIETAASF